MVSTLSTNRLLNTALYIELDPGRMIGVVIVLPPDEPIARIKNWARRWNTSYPPPLY